MQGPVDAASVPATAMEWRVHLAAENPVKAAFAVMLIGCCLGAIHQVTGDGVHTGIGLVIFLIVLAPFFYPMIYRVDASGITSKVMGCSRHLEWTRVSRYDVSARGVYLAVSSRSSVFCDRGMYVMFGRQREEILAGIKAWLEAGPGIAGERVSR